MHDHPIDLVNNPAQFRQDLIRIVRAPIHIEGAVARLGRPTKLKSFAYVAGKASRFAIMHRLSPKKAQEHINAALDSAVHEIQIYAQRTLGYKLKGLDKIKKGVLEAEMVMYLVMLDQVEGKEGNYDEFTFQGYYGALRRKARTAMSQYKKPRIAALTKAYKIGRAHV